MLSLPSKLPVCAPIARITRLSSGYPVPDLEDSGRKQNEAPTVQWEMVRDLLHHLDRQKSMGPNEIHPRVLRELVKLFAKLLSIIHQQSCLTSEIPVDWKLAKVKPTYKKGHKEDLENHRSVYQPDISAWEGYGAEHLECMQRGLGPASMDLQKAGPG
ncbi:RNA-directed DNA polymerase from mobile element jockey [Willisornis vidua]|uniref:RNA-directed DNA polymerase from mobile element jockey n=1 Tax=Willisornis vidua TaxID=1566151 RepID=A0ABQ9CNU1_9PASS|nr:RNA-directed DNA polymerase from mobile element jockey [Willisornis vidua]